MIRGEVRWYRLSRPDNRRPVLVATRDSVLKYLGEVTVAPIRTTVREIPSEVYLSTTDGMPLDCAVNCDHLQTVSKAGLGGLVTTLSPAKMEEVAGAVSFALGLG